MSLKNIFFLMPCKKQHFIINFIESKWNPSFYFE